MPENGNDGKKTEERPAIGPGFGPGRGPMGGMHEQKRAKDVRGTVRRLVRYLTRFPAALIGVAILVTAATGFNVAGPYLLGRAIDTVIIGGDLPLLVQAVLILAGVYLVSALSMLGHGLLMVGVSQKTLRDIRKDLFHRLQDLSLRYFDSRTHGETMSRMTNDVENIGRVLAQGVSQLVSASLTVVGVAAVMIGLNPRMAAITLVMLPLMAVITRIISKYTRRGFRAQQKDLGELNGLIEETVGGQRVVISFGRQHEAIHQFDDANERLRGSSTQAQTAAGMMGPVMNMVNNLSFAIIAGTGGWLAISGLATIGTVAAFVNYSRQFARPLNEIANLYNLIHSALAGAERIFEVIDEQPDIQDAPDALQLERIGGHVEFRDVCFAYEPDKPVLIDINLKTGPGKTVALVGRTGAGKTTIVNLLSRFYDVDSGSILVDDRDIRTVTQDSLRRQLGIVLQDTYLFTESVMENIRYGRLDADDAAVINAAKQANADHFIRHLPKGYDTILSEEGSNLSQGQRQLLAIARAILADPAVLILDEATSSVDTRTERHIQEAMLELMKGRTSFIIAHRLGTIKGADEILVIEGGRIIERGTHAGLMEGGGRYRELYMSQFTGLEALPNRSA